MTSFPLFLFFSLLSSLPSLSSSITDPHDVTALTALHAAWDSNPSSWDTSTDPCTDQWLGVECDSTNTRVTKLLLINQVLNGNLPAQIGDLTNLTDLDLSSNPKLGGPLPPQIGNLTHLVKLFVQFCNFSGLIPSEIGNLLNLQYLGLTQNFFSGSLPASIGLLKQMIWLDVSSNNLNGTLPDSTSTVTGSGLDNLTNAIHFHLQNNSFSGSIPSSIFNSHMQLQHLLLHDNNFSGTIPSVIGDMQHVQIVRFDSNQLTGIVPSNISRIQNLTTLQLNHNGLNGSLPDLSNNTKLQILDLSNNPFDASTIPTWIANLPNLYLLSLQSVNLIGEIPEDIFTLSHISNVTLGSNKLNGTLSLNASSSLLIVNVTDNSITGLDKGNYTKQLLLDGNPYCTNNSRVCTSSESVTPPAAAPASSCTNGCPDEYATNPKYSGDCQCFRPVVGNVTFVASKLPLLNNDSISLMEQQFASGLTLFSNVNRTFLDSQVVVNVISSSQVMVSVFPPNTTDLWIPNDAVRIAYVLKNQDIEFADIGPLICGFMGTPYNSVVVVNKLSTGAKVGIGVGVSVFVIATIVIATYALKQKKRAETAEKQNKPFASWIAASQGETPDIPQLKGARWFSLDEIRKCTNNFSHNNEIGEGGYGKVYKGFLLTGDRVAVKRAGASSLQGAAEFKNEIELLSRVHHRNLVGLIGFCFEEGEQMLVYEYMPNGTIRECLSGRTGLNMDWERRTALALGAARGIAYLHTEANPPIIHRDIKSNNILLDDKLVAKVADFGLSKLAPDEDGTTPMSTEVKGTLGYLDPDYFMTNRLTEKSDVYSFGVVLLELATGRPPIQGGKYVVREVRTAMAQGGMEAVVKSMVDPNLTDFPPEAMQRFLELALSCVEDDPGFRPTMAEVVKELESVAPRVRSGAIHIEEDRSALLYAEGSPYMTQENPESSFMYSGSYAAMPRTVEPK